MPGLCQGQPTRATFGDQVTRAEIVNLRVGQHVITKVAPTWRGTIARIFVPAAGERVVEIEGYLPNGKRGRVWVGTGEVELV